MLILIAVLIGLPVMVLGQVLADNASRDSRATELGRVQAGATVGASTVAGRIDGLIIHTELISATGSLRNLLHTADSTPLIDIPALEAWLADRVAVYDGQVSRLYILDPKGQFISSFPVQRALRGFDFSHADYYVTALEKTRPAVSSVHGSSFANQPAVATIAAQIRDQNGVLLGVLCADLDLVRAQDWVLPLTGLYDDLYIVDENAFLVLGVNGTDDKPLRNLGVDPNVRAAIRGEPVNPEVTDLFAGARRYVSAARVAGTSWTLLVGESPAASTQRLAQLSDGLLVLRLVLLAMLLGAGVIISRTTLRQQQVTLANLMKLNKSKSDFVSVVSHEFRTPLTGIQGFSEMIRDEALSPADIKDFANDINKDAHRLSRMINELLDLDRMESGRMKLDRERVDLGARVTEAVDHGRPNAAGHRFVVELDTAAIEIWADRDRITQVLTNLVSNAVKYSPAGGTITVGTTRLDDAAHVWVRDEGMGIPPESLELVFERYSRLETAATRTIQGTGLGLPIVREIVQAHGGRVWAENNVGKGSTFHVTLPFSARSET
jgi:signal transduction histidine kinase